MNKFSPSPFFGVMAGWGLGMGVYLAARASGALILLLGIGFLFGLPYVIGLVTVAVSPRSKRTDMMYGALIPFVPCALLCLAVILLQWELIICIVMALPILLPVASIGGITAVRYFRSRYEAEAEAENNNKIPKGLSAIVLLPLILGAMEARLPNPDMVRTVETERVIQANPQTIWSQITSVPQIQDDERPFSMLDLLDFPKPMEADLMGEGVGAMRHAHYENGLVLLEPVTEWEPNTRYTFHVEVDPELTPAPYDQIGGEHFDVLEVGYTLEPLTDGSGRTRVQLHTTYRVSTHFNAYSALWIDFLMRDLQNTILHVVEERAE